MTVMNPPGEPSAKEVMIGLHHNLEWLKGFIRMSGDGRDKPPEDEAITEVQEYIERAVGRLSTPPPSATTGGTVQ